MLAPAGGIFSVALAFVPSRKALMNWMKEATNLLLVYTIHFSKRSKTSFFSSKKAQLWWLSDPPYIFTELITKWKISKNCGGVCHVCPLTQFFLFPFCKKTILFADPSSGEHFSLSLLPTTLLSTSRMLEGVFEQTHPPPGPSTWLASCIAFGTTEKQGHRHSSGVPH